MHWLLTTHARRYQKKYRVTGHVWQGRFRAFAIAEDQHLRTVRAVHRAQPLACGFGTQGEVWCWSSLRRHLQPLPLPFLHPGPVPRPADWAGHVKCAADRSRIGGAAAVRRPWDAVRRCGLGATDRRSVGVRVHVAFSGKADGVAPRAASVARPAPGCLT